MQAEQLPESEIYRRLLESTHNSQPSGVPRKSRCSGHRGMSIEEALLSQGDVYATRRAEATANQVRAEAETATGKPCLVSQETGPDIERPHDVIDRLSRIAKNTENKRRLLAEQRGQEEAEECTWTPETNKTDAAESMTQRERIEYFQLRLKSRNERRTKMQAQARAAEAEEATFKPTIRRRSAHLAKKHDAKLLDQLETYAGAARGKRVPREDVLLASRALQAAAHAASDASTPPRPSSANARSHAGAAEKTQELYERGKKKLLTKSQRAPRDGVSPARQRPRMAHARSFVRTRPVEEDLLAWRRGGLERRTEVFQAMSRLEQEMHAPAINARSRELAGQALASLADSPGNGTPDIQRATAASQNHPQSASGSGPSVPRGDLTPRHLRARSRSNGRSSRSAYEPPVTTFTPTLIEPPAGVLTTRRRGRASDSLYKLGKSSLRARRQQEEERAQAEAEVTALRPTSAARAVSNKRAERKVEHLLASWQNAQRAKEKLREEANEQQLRGCTFRPQLAARQPVWEAPARTPGQASAESTFLARMERGRKLKRNTQLDYRAIPQTRWSGGGTSPTEFAMNGHRLRPRDATDQRSLSSLEPPMRTGRDTRPIRAALASGRATVRPTSASRRPASRERHSTRAKPQPHLMIFSDFAGLVASAECVAAPVGQEYAAARAARPIY
eukprot:gnl/Chilomastix_cuspidata/4346.p1 GENE.gnl/Chilomastix_cuspidata/4346~~gnl/Chilomastix_cuspidata/4346.p1  ORF type:complete len:678 (+),score=164.06 gnl/Chilomastix_cuspidata/4346:68-2101(+)